MKTRSQRAILTGRNFKNLDSPIPFRKLTTAELLRYVDTVGVDSNPLVMALADALHGCDPMVIEQLEEKIEQLEEKNEKLEREADEREAEARQDGWEYGLEVARDLLDDELDTSATGRDQENELEAVAVEEKQAWHSNDAILAVGPDVARECEAVAVNCYRNFLIGKGYLRVISKPLPPNLGTQQA